MGRPPPSVRTSRREITAEHTNVKRAREPKVLRIKPADIVRILGFGGATDYRYLGLEDQEG